MKSIFKRALTITIFLPQLFFAQAFNELSTTLALNNPAYHPDLKVHGKGFLSSDLTANTGFFFSTNSKNAVNQNFLRYQLGLGRWKFGISSQHIGFSGQNNLNIGLNLGRDFIINRDLNWRVAASGFQNGGFIIGSGNLIPSYSAQLGVQANYKDWSFFAAGGNNGLNIGATQRFDLDSTQKFIATVFYERYFGFQTLCANVIYQYKDFSLLMGGAFRSYLMGVGYQFENGHALMLSSKWQGNLLSNGKQLNLQLGYHFSLTHRPSFVSHTTITPSF
jgi:hypothetical protein